MAKSSIASNAKLQKASLWSKFSDYMPQERAQIGKYAVENGPTKAAKHFSQVLNRKVPETTIFTKSDRVGTHMQ